MERESLNPEELLLEFQLLLGGGADSLSSQSSFHPELALEVLLLLLPHPDWACGFTEVSSFHPPLPALPPLDWDPKKMFKQRF